MAVTQKDIAEKTGFSVMTVSRVLNGKETHIGESTREAIRKTAAALGYRPNATAKALRSGSSRTIGLLIGGLAERWQGCLIHTLLNLLSERGYALRIATSNYSRVQEEKALCDMLETSPDGIILNFSFRETSPLYRKLKKERYPLLLTEPWAKDFNAVSRDYKGEFLTALREFSLNGCRKIAFFENRKNDPVYQNLPADSGVELEKIPVESNGPSHCRAFERVLRSDCDGFFISGEDLSEFFRFAGPAADRLKCIGTYSLPFEYWNHPSMLGMIHVPFREQTELITEKILESVEHPGLAKKTVLVPFEYRNMEQISELRNRQRGDRFYERFLY